MSLARSVAIFDTAIIGFIQRLPAFMGPVMSTVSFLGLPSVVVASSVAAIIYAWSQGKMQIATAFGLVLVGLATNSLIKLVLQRPRPDTEYAAAIRFPSYSLPSGHAYDGAAFYGLLAVLAFRYLPQPWNVVGATLFTALGVLVGLSRIYLGAHYPSDVLAGWLLGGVVLFLITKYVL